VRVKLGTMIFILYYNSFINFFNFNGFMAKKYSIDNYFRFKRFVDAVDKSNVDVSDVSTHNSAIIDEKRDLLGLLHNCLIGVGGVRLPLAECNPCRVSYALKSEYLRAKKAVEFYDGVCERNIISNVNNLLSLEARARCVFDESPLFDNGSLAAVQNDIADYLCGLSRDERKYVGEVFGDRIKQYLK